MEAKIKNLCCILSPWSGSLAMGEKIRLYLFDSIFSGIVWIDKLNNCVKVICFNIKKTGKRLFLVMVAKEKKILHQ